MIHFAVECKFEKKQDTNENFIRLMFSFIEDEKKTLLSCAIGRNIYPRYKAMLETGQKVKVIGTEQIFLFNRRLLITKHIVLKILFFDWDKKKYKMVPEDLEQAREQMKHVREIRRKKLLENHPAPSAEPAAPKRKRGRPKKTVKEDFTAVAAEPEIETMPQYEESTQEIEYDEYGDPIL